MPRSVLAAALVTLILNMRRHRYEESQAILLPWPIEAFFAVAGVLSTLGATWWFVGEIRSPSLQLEKIFGVPVDVQPVITAFTPLMWIAGAAFGVRVWLSLRRWFIRKVSSLC
jgi:hypothetical protein